MITTWLVRHREDRTCSSFLYHCVCTISFSGSIVLQYSLLLRSPLAPPPAHLAPGDPAAKVARLQGLADRAVEHVPGLDGGEPEGELVGEVVARAPGTVALDERGGSEVLEARTGRGKGLATTFGSSRCVLERRLVKSLVFCPVRKRLRLPWQSCIQATELPSLADSPGCSCPGCEPRSRSSAPRRQRTCRQRLERFLLRN